MLLFHAPRTRASRVVWMLEEAGVDYALEPVDMMSKTRSAAHLLASPMGKVPAIRDGEVAMSESAAICLYVADKYARQLAPAIDAPERGAFLYWMMFTPAVIEPCMAEKAADLAPKPQRNGWGSFDQMISTLERQLQDRAWLLDSGFSAADVMVGSSVLFLRLFKMFEASDILDAYADRCAARPAYKKAMRLEQ